MTRDLWRNATEPHEWLLTWRSILSQEGNHMHEPVHSSGSVHVATGQAKPVVI